MTYTKWKDTLVTPPSFLVLYKVLRAFLREKAYGEMWSYIRYFVKIKTASKSTLDLVSTLTQKQVVGIQGDVEKTLEKYGLFLQDLNKEQVRDLINFIISFE